jgi:hypothetical protein
MVAGATPRQRQGGQPQRQARCRLHDRKVVPWAPRWFRDPYRDHVLSDGSPLWELLRIAGPAVAPAAGLDDSVPGRLNELLQSRNGFYAFESALHVLPWAAGPDPATMDLGQWNDDALWRRGYDGLADGLTFFAEDLFGGQFALRGVEVVTFEPETGDVTWLAADLDGWAGRLLEDYRLLTGQPLGHDWQASQGPLPAGKRLLPKRPFVLGGGYEVANLYALDATRGMQLRGELAVQLRDLPEGAKVRFTIVD